MKETLLKQWGRAKEQWGKLTAKTKKLICGVLVAVVLMSAGAAVFLNLSGGSLTPLYPDMSKTETAQAFAALSQSGTVNATMSASGVIEVPRSQLSEAQLVLAENGIPQTTNTYDTFLKNTSFTMTESERQQLLIMQLQDSITQTLLAIDGVDTCIVNLNVATQSDRIWEDTSVESTASVLIGMKPGYKLSPDRVSGIKNLVAYSIPNSALNVNNIRVIDASTGVDMEENASLLPGVDGDYTRLQYEAQIEKSIENKILKLLAPMYPDGQVTAVATVRLNYDIVKQQDDEVIPGDNGEGVKTHEEIDYTLNNGVPIGEIVGEENNTDTPVYQNNAGDGDGDTTNFHSSVDWDITRRTVQTEKGTATIEYASASVLVQDENFTAEQADRLKTMISKAVNIQPERLSVEYFGAGSGITTPAGANGQLDIRLLLIVGGVALVLIIIAVILMIIMSKKSKKKRHEAEVQRKEAEDLLRNAQQEVEDRKRALASAAQANNALENGIAEDIRKFAKENPEITANLIRSMLKEEE
ncbi:MAG: flagellar basal-body MS-ring/collar protein FliF [Oscillospiraceae bacterium]|nr:flagellar basal-body MS-ring/collar protein FliF [Oscillospiraceae bacterium]